MSYVNDVHLIRIFVHSGPSSATRYYGKGHHVSLNEIYIVCDESDARFTLTDTLLK
jgi:hypothetical protein